MKSIVERMMGRVAFAQLIEAYRTVYQSALLQSPVILTPSSASSTCWGAADVRGGRYIRGDRPTTTA